MSEDLKALVARVDACTPHPAYNNLTLEQIAATDAEDFAVALAYLESNTDWNSEIFMGAALRAYRYLARQGAAWQASHETTD